MIMIISKISQLKLKSSYRQPAKLSKVQNKVCTMAKSVFIATQNTSRRVTITNFYPDVLFGYSQPQILYFRGAGGTQFPSMPRSSDSHVATQLETNLTKVIHGVFTAKLTTVTSFVNTNYLKPLLKTVFYGLPFLLSCFPPIFMINS